MGAAAAPSAITYWSASIKPFEVLTAATELRRITNHCDLMARAAQCISCCQSHNPRSQHAHTHNQSFLTFENYLPAIYQLLTSYLPVKFMHRSYD